MCIFKVLTTKLHNQLTNKYFFKVTQCVLLSPKKVDTMKVEDKLCTVSTFKAVIYVRRFTFFAASQSPMCTTETLRRFCAHKLQPGRNGNEKRNHDLLEHCKQTF